MLKPITNNHVNCYSVRGGFRPP